MFTKQHYIKIAETLVYGDANLQWSTISLFSQMFKEDNPRFDQDKFEKYVKKLMKEVE